jgi:hypothetical protein
MAITEQAKGDRIMPPTCNDEQTSTAKDSVYHTGKYALSYTWEGLDYKTPYFDGDKSEDFWNRLPLSLQEWLSANGCPPVYLNILIMQASIKDLLKASQKSYSFVPITIKGTAEVFHAALIKGPRQPSTQWDDVDLMLLFDWDSTLRAIGITHTTAPTEYKLWDEQLPETLKGYLESIGYSREGFTEKIKAEAQQAKMEGSPRLLRINTDNPKARAWQRFPRENKGNKSARLE